MNKSTLRPARLKRLREICLALPGATEKEAWGDPTWRVGDKIFAMQKGNYGGGRPSVWLKAQEGAQVMLVAADPERYFVPPYVGHKGWIGVYMDTPRVAWPMLADLIAESHRLVGKRRKASQARGSSGSTGNDVDARRRR